MRNTVMIANYNGVRGVWIETTRTDGYITRSLFIPDDSDIIHKMSRDGSWEFGEPKRAPAAGCFEYY